MHAPKQLGYPNTGNRSLPAGIAAQCTAQSSEQWGRGVLHWPFIQWCLKFPSQRTLSIWHSLRSWDLVHSHLTDIFSFYIPSSSLTLSTAGQQCWNVVALLTVPLCRLYLLSPNLLGFDYLCTARIASHTTNSPDWWVAEGLFQGEKKDLQRKHGDTASPVICTSNGGCSHYTPPSIPSGQHVWLLMIWIV